jgi:acyl carrier protein phosphodiesterase
MGESQLNEYFVKGGMPAKEVLGLNLFQDFDPQEGLSIHYEDFASDSAWQNVEKQYAPIAKALKQRVLQLNRPLTDAEANAIDDTWYDGSDAYDDVDASYLAGIYDEQIDKIEALIAGNLTDEEFGESVEDDEASPADIAGADKNIIMQIRKAKDYEKPTTLELADGNTVRIDSMVASKILGLFDGLRPDSKALMQQTLNSNEGFHEILNYLNEREVLESMADIDLISNHMKPVLEARNKARNLIKSVFGKA